MSHPAIRRRSLTLLVLPLLLASVGPLACGGKKQSDSQARPRVNTTMLTREEITSGHWANAYDLIESMRPRWLSSRGADLLDGSSVEVQVYLDDQRLGGTANLRSIALDDIMSIQFIDPVSAAARWGPDHHNGVIYMSTRNR
ncbi:MAG TPA: hypothetical protein VKA84_03590 [Gemmatimonadaceae bacterium]|nr:hypothetical protein [Gemmatimonadaceae bacterium]